MSAATECCAAIASHPGTARGKRNAPRGEKKGKEKEERKKKNERREKERRKRGEGGRKEDYYLDSFDFSYARRFFSATLCLFRSSHS